MNAFNDVALLALVLIFPALLVDFTYEAWRAERSARAKSR